MWQKDSSNKRCFSLVEFYRKQEKYSLTCMHPIYMTRRFVKAKCNKNFFSNSSEVKTKTVFTTMNFFVSDNHIVISAGNMVYHVKRSRKKNSELKQCEALFTPNCQFHAHIFRIVLLSK